MISSHDAVETVAKRRSESNIVSGMNYDQGMCVFESSFHRLGVHK